MPNVRTFLLGLFLMFFSITSNAQWEKLKLEGGMVTNVVQTDSFLFLLNFEGVFKSTKNPISWTRINSTGLTNKINFNSYDVKIASVGNSIFVFNNNLVLLESINQGSTWNSIFPNIDHRIKSIFELNNNAYVIANSVADTLDSTIVYKRNANSWQVVKIFPFNVDVIPVKDTVFYRFVDSNYFSNWFSTTNFVNANAYTPNQFWSIMSNVTRCKNRFIGLHQYRDFYQSFNGTNWIKLSDLPNKEKIYRICTNENDLFVVVNTLALLKVYKYNFEMNNWDLLPIKPSEIYAVSDYNNTRYFSTNYGLYTTLNDTVFNFNMKGIFNPSLLWMNTIGNSIFVKTRDTVFSSINHGNSWIVSPYFQSGSTEMKFYPIGAKIYAFHLDKIYISNDNGLSWNSYSLLDTNLGFPQYKGFDDSSIYINASNKITKEEVYLRTSNGVTFEILNMKINGTNIFPSAIFEDNDTLFAIGPYTYKYYYSVNRGNTWIIYPSQNPIPTSYFVDNFFNYLNKVYVYSVDFNLVNDDIALVRNNSKWKEIDLFNGLIDQSKVFVNGNEIYTLRADRLLQYSLDTFRTIKNSSFKINFLPGYKSKSFAMIGRRVFVEIINNGIWTNILDAPLSLERKDFTELHVFPNPANNMIIVNLSSDISGDLKYIMYSMHSQIVLQNVITSNELMDSKLGIDITSVPNGFYLLKMESNSQKYYSKIIINH